MDMTRAEAEALTKEIEASDCGWFKAWVSGHAYLYDHTAPNPVLHPVMVLDRNTGFEFGVDSRQEWLDICSSRRAAS